MNLSLHQVDAHRIINRGAFLSIFHSYHHLDIVTSMINVTIVELSINIENTNTPQVSRKQNDNIKNILITIYKE